MTPLRPAIIKSAHAVWARDVHEPTRRGEISHEITRLWDGIPFWGGWLRTAGKCPHGYTRPPDPDWCGVFVAYVLRHVGDYLEPDMSVPVTLKSGLAQHVLTSTYRLQSAEKWRAAGVTQPQPGRARDIQPGDVVTVNPSTAKPYGSHIVLAASALDAAGVFQTYEGNAYGRRGDGSMGKGVIRTHRRIGDVARVYPLSVKFFDGAGFYV